MNGPPSPGADPNLDEILALVGRSVLPIHDSAFSLPDHGGGDVDCIVEDIDQLWPLRLPHGWILRQRFHYDATGWMWTLQHPGGWVRIDALEDPLGIGRYGFPTRLAIGDEALPASTVRAAYLTAKRVRKRSVSPREWEVITELAQREPRLFEGALGRIFGSKSGGQLAAAVLEEGMATSRLLRRGAASQLFCRASHPVKLPVLAARAAGRIARRLNHPTGIFVLIVGPDGSGKSTLAAELPIACREVFRRSTHFHWRPGLLPRPGDILGTAPEIDPAAPHAQPPRGPLASAVLVIYYWLDFGIGGIARILWPRWRTGLVVGERGWWDFLVDPRRYRSSASPRLISILGRLVPKPDVLVVLESSAETMFARKSELDIPELKRQSLLWRQINMPAVDRVVIDADQSKERVLDLASKQVLSSVGERAAAMLGPGWVSLPSGSSPRWLIPRGPRRVTKAALSVYQPVTHSARLGWRAANILAHVGGFKWLPRGKPPPLEVRELLAPHIPLRGTIALARSNHPGRYLASLLEPSGKPHAVAKIALDDAACAALDREADAIESYGASLPGPLRAPGVLAREQRLLLLAAVEWQSRRRPWELPEVVAHGLGSLFRSGAIEGTDGELLGACHGDCAPWNLLLSGDGWTLVDWEEFDPAGSAFFDLFHFLVQSHELLGRPSRDEIQAGLNGAGWIGRAINAYADAALLEPREALRLFPSFRDFLEEWRSRQPPSIRPVRSVWK